MNKIAYIFALQLLSFTSFSQTYYFPPITGTTWETATPQSLGWCTEKIDTLYNYLENTNTKAFMVLKNGKIVLEKYFGTFTRDSAWYWASAGKTLTGFTVGIAQQEGFLKLDDLSSKYLGTGWTSASLTKENLITVRHQLTMTSGLDDGTSDTDCTLPSCLKYKADAGTRWAYHNAPYTLLDKVIETATGGSLNNYVQSKIRTKTGMTGLYVKVDYNNVFFSTARSMARFGLLLLNKGKWENTPVLSDTAYFRQMVNTSQNINLSYGYLTWLNGKPSAMVPQSQIVFPFSISPDAYPDMYAALGKNGQLINVVPSQGLVMVRMGNNPENSLVPFTYNNEVWKRLNLVICNRTSSLKNELDTEGVSLYPNPAHDILFVEVKNADIAANINIINTLGQIIKTEKLNNPITSFDISHLPKGLYAICFEDKNRRFIKTFFKN